MIRITGIRKEAYKIKNREDFEKLWFIVLDDLIYFFDEIKKDFFIEKVFIEENYFIEALDEINKLYKYIKEKENINYLKFENKIKKYKNLILDFYKKLEEKIENENKVFRSDNFEQEERRKKFN